MANVIKTVLTYNLNGSTRDFNIPFEYLTRKFVTVTLLGRDRKELVMNTDYRFATRTTISTTKAWGPADGYSQIEIRRNTSATERLVDFTDGSILRAYDLNVAQIQTMHIAEEARDLTADTIGVNNNGDLDARNRRIVNVANAVDDRDAVPFGQLKTMNNNAYDSMNKALQYRNEAQTFRNQAETFKNEANTSKNAAANSQNAAKTSETNAKNSETNALNSKNAASASQGAAANSANAAKASENNASASATRADQWANKDHGQVVADNRYSAKHWAEEARIEANKLGSWNALAGTIDNVNGINVTFKGIVGALGEFRSASANGLRIAQGDYSTIIRQDGASTYIMTTNKGDKWGSYSSLRPIRIDNAEGSVWFGHGTHANQYNVTKQAFFRRNMLKLENENFADRSVNVRVWGASGRNNVYEWADENGWMMYVQRREWTTATGGNIQMVVNGQILSQGGAMTAQLKLQNGHALQLESAANKAHYIISKDGDRNNWYVGRGSDNNNDVLLHSYVHGTSLALRQNYAQVNKHFYVGTSVLATDGNIQGTKWGGKWLDVYLNDTFVKKTKGWTRVWAHGSGYLAGGQQISGLSQDLRFRNIWIKCSNNSFNFFRTGADNIYFIASDGGWLRFQIFSSGRGFKNVADNNSPPREIWVENE